MKVSTFLRMRVLILALYPSYCPLRASSIKLKNLQNRLGLDIIGAVTFGALSKGELDLALNTALPRNLSEDQLVGFLRDKRNAQVKLRDSITEFAQFTGAGDKTIAEWLEFKKQKRCISTISRGKDSSRVRCTTIRCNLY